MHAAGAMRIGSLRCGKIMRDVDMQRPEKYKSWRSLRREANTRAVCWGCTAVPHTHEQHGGERLYKERRCGTRRGKPPQGGPGVHPSAGSARLRDSLIRISDDYTRSRQRPLIIAAATGALAQWQLPESILQRIFAFLPPEPAFVPTVELQVELAMIDPHRNPYIHIAIYTSTSQSIYPHRNADACMHACMHACMLVCMYACM